MASSKISAKAFVCDLQRGLSDSDLMLRHGISEESLPKVFKKLLDLGLVDSRTLEARNIRPAVSPRNLSPRKISAKDLVNDLNAGLGAGRLMMKYCLTPHQLDKLLVQLKERALIGQCDFAAAGSPDQELTEAFEVPVPVGENHEILLHECLSPQDSLGTEGLPHW